MQQTTWFSIVNFQCTGSYGSLFLAYYPLSINRVYNFQILYDSPEIDICVILLCDFTKILVDWFLL